MQCMPSIIPNAVQFIKENSPIDFVWIGSTASSFLPNAGASVVFVSACIVTTQIALSILSGVSTLGIIQVIMILGSWIGYAHMIDREYLQAIQQTIPKIEQQLAEQRALVQKRDEQLLVAQTNIQNLQTEQEKLSGLMIVDTENTETLTEGVAQATKQAKDRSAQLEQQKDLLSKQNILTQTLRALTEENSREPVDSDQKKPLCTGSVLEREAGSDLMRALSKLGIET